MTNFVHDPEAVLDYAIDWTAWLGDGETITTHTVTGTNITIDETSETDGVVTVWVSGAEAARARITCQITTNQGRTDDRTIVLDVQDR